MLVLLGLQLMGGMVSSPQRTFLPVYLSDLGYSALFVSWMATAQRLTGLAAAALGGSLSDSLGRERTLLLGQLVVLLAGLVFFAASPWPIVLLCALSGVGYSLQTLGGQSYLLDNARSESLGVLTALYNWGYTLGGALGGPLAALLLQARDYRAFALALTLFSLLTLLVNRLFLPPSRTVPAPASTGSRSRGYGQIARRPTSLLLAALRFLPTFYWGMAQILIPLMLHRAGASISLIALYATLSQVVATLAQIVAGRAADRFGCPRPALLTFALLACGVFWTALAPSSVGGIFASGTLGASAAWALSTLTPSMVARVTAPAERGRVLGWVHLWWNAAMVVGSLVGGALFELGAGLPFGVAGAGVLLAGGLAALFFRRTAALSPA